jgi:predicted deacylase
MLKSFIISGQRPGPQILFLGGVHGNEPCGVIAIRNLIEKFHSRQLALAAGQVTFVPSCNERALALNVPYTEENLNRCIRRYTNPIVYEHRIAQELTEYIDRCDLLIDIHSTTAPTKPFGFLDTDSTEGRILARGVGLETVIIGWPELYAESDEPSTQTYADALGKLSITIECGQNEDKEAATRAERYIMNTLAFLACLLITRNRLINIRSLTYE